MQFALFYNKAGCIELKQPPQYIPSSGQGLKKRKA